ncbi:MAG: hypothetical protein R6V52_07315 [Bacteroidales bacterium]
MVNNQGTRAAFTCKSGSFLLVPARRSMSSPLVAMPCRQITKRILPELSGFVLVRGSSPQQKNRPPP